MGVLSDFFIASDSDALDYDGGQSIADADRRQFKQITPLEAASILAVLRDENDPLMLIDEFELLTPEDAEHWTMSVPIDMVEKLARLPTSDVPQLAAKLSHFTEEELAWSQEEFEFVVTELADLARKSVATGKRMFLWNSM